MLAYGADWSGCRSICAIQLADWDAVKRAHGLLAERGLLRGTADHGVTRSLYTADPDGNEIELFCDAPREEWEGESTRLTVLAVGLGGAFAGVSRWGHTR